MIDGFIVSVILLVLLSFFASFLDAGFGMGYGTVLTPLLILLNFPLLEIVPAVLFSQIIAAGLTAITYHLHGNIQFTRSSEDTKIAGVMSLTGVLGACIAIIIFYTLLGINMILFQFYISVAIIFVGFFVLAKFQWRLSWARLFTISTLASINKGLSGGGYTPIVAGYQILSGREGKQSIGSTTISKAVISITAVTLYIILGHLLFDPIFFQLAIPLLIGAFIAVPIASYLVKRIEGERMSFLVGLAIICLGAITLVRTFFVLFILA